MKKALIIFVLLISFVEPIVAQDIIINCDAENSCISSRKTALFSTIDQWYPGKIVTKFIRIKNVDKNNDINIRTQIEKLQNGSDNCRLDQKIFFGITKLDLNKAYSLMWFGLIKDFNGLSLEKLAPGKEADFYYSLSLDNSAGNECQKTAINFDLGFSFVSEAQNIASQSGAIVTPIKKGEIKGVEKKDNPQTKLSFWMLSFTLIIPFAIIYFILRKRIGNRV